MYVAEAAPAHMRGQLVTVNQLFITFGQFFASVIDGIFSSNLNHGWRYCDKVFHYSGYCHVIA